MYQKIMIVILTVALFNSAGSAKIFARSSDEKERGKIEKIKREIERLGSGKQTRVKVRLNDDTKLKGFIGEIKDDSFVVKNSETGQTTEIGYDRVAKVSGKNFSTGAKIAVGLGIAAAAVVVVLARGKVCKNSLCR